MAKAWRFDKTYDFYKDLSMRESSNNQQAARGSHLGFYQLPDHHE